MLKNDDLNPFTDSQQRFLKAYEERPVVARAARLAGVHRATVYRWKAVPGFAVALDAAAARWRQIHRQQVLAAEVRRREWRESRERARWPMRCRVLTQARRAKTR